MWLRRCCIGHYMSRRVRRPTLAIKMLNKKSSVGALAILSVKKNR